MRDDAVVLGVGMTAWGKWGRPFVDYGVAAAREALDDAGIEWAEVDLIVGGQTVRNGYAGYVAGSTVAGALGFTGAQVATVYGACASGAMAIDHGRAYILAGLADVVLVVGADTTPKGFLAPNAGERPDDPELAPVPPPRRHEPRLLRPLRPAPDAPLRRHGVRLRQGQGEELPPRRRQLPGPLPQ